MPAALQATQTYTLGICTTNRETIDSPQLQYQGNRATPQYLQLSSFSGFTAIHQFGQYSTMPGITVKLAYNRASSEVLSARLCRQEQHLEASTHKSSREVMLGTTTEAILCSNYTKCVCGSAVPRDEPDLYERSQALGSAIHVQRVKTGFPSTRSYAQKKCIC